MTLRISAPYARCGERGTALNKRIGKSLKLQMLCAVLISFLVAGIVYFASFLSGNMVLDKTVYGHVLAKNMSEKQFEKLQEYVDEEGISLENLQRLNAWSSRGDKVYLTIYHEEELIYEYPTSGSTSNKTHAIKFDPDMESPDNEFVLELQGGVQARTFLYYYMGDAYYFWMMALSGIAAFFAFSFCFVSLIGRKVAYIGTLRKELDILSGGQLGYAVTVSGKDELAELALGIDQMRCSIMKHQEIENQIKTANSELITAMSHDLRTPLTSLLAYLEIIERKKYANEEQMYNLIHKSVEQTMRIKNMADKLFEYFLVYATEWEYSETETVDADQLFCQILEDYTYALESKDMVVESDFSPVCGKIAVNMDLLHRVLDNLYSNLIKYADKTRPIQISYKREDAFFVLSVVNKIGVKRERRDSTSIGLNTCDRIVKYHGGKFETDEKEDAFYVKVWIPLR